MTAAPKDYSYLFREKEPISPSTEKKEDKSYIFKTPKSKQVTQEPFPFEGENDLEREIERGSARSLSRVGESMLGSVGDLQNFVKDVTGMESPLFGLQASTTKQFQEQSEKLTKGYTKPQTAFDESVDEYMHDVGSFMLPGGGAKGPTRQIIRTIGVPLVANLAREGIKKYGGSEGQQTAGKIGAMVISDLLFHRFTEGGAGKMISGLFNEVGQSIPQGAKADVPGFLNSLNTLKQTLQRGGTTPTTTKALTKIDEILNKISNGQIDAVEFPAFRKTINDAITEYGGWNIEVPPSLKDQAIRNLNQVKSEVIKAGEDYGKTQNPRFLKAWQDANEASAAYQQSNRISNYIQKNFGNKFKSVATKALFGLGGTSALGLGAKFIPGATAGGSVLGGVALAGYNAIKYFTRVKNSPVLRKYYTNVLKEALKGNATAMNQNLSKLDAKLAEEEKKEKELVEKYTKS